MEGSLLTLPRLGETMEEGKIIGWLIAPGDRFKRGDPILEIETDKTVAELPALADGILAETLVGPGETVSVGTPIARLFGGEGDEREAEPSRTVAVLAMPRLGETMEEGRVVGWLVEEGASFRRGDPFVEIETDKTVAEVPALVDGTLLEQLAAPGTMLAVGAPLARLDVDAGVVGMEGFVESELAAADAAAPEQAVPARNDVETMAQVETPAVVSPTAPARAGLPLRATPAARRLAARSTVDLAEIAGSGRRSRIEAWDVERHIEGRGALGTTGSPQGQQADDRSGIAFDQYGTREAARGGALLLHGFAADRTTFSAFASMLARTGYHVVVPDLPGHGSTRVAAEAADDLAPPLRDFLELQGFAPAELVAHSLGSVAAVALAENLPSVRRLTLLCPAGLGVEIDGDFIAGMAGRPSPGALRHLLRRLTARPAPLSDSAVAALSRSLAAGRLQDLAADAFGPHGQRVDIVGPLARLTKRIKVRVVFGLEDRVIPWMQVQAVPSRVSIHLVAGAGHLPHWDQPAEVLALFED